MLPCAPQVTSAIANSHILQVSRAHLLSLPVLITSFSSRHFPSSGCLTHPHVSTTAAPKLTYQLTFLWLTPLQPSWSWSWSYATTNSQSASHSWCWASCAHDRIFITVRHLRVCWCGAPFLMRGWVCTLQRLVGIVSAVILGSKSRRTHAHILPSQIWDFPNMEGYVLISPGTGWTSYTPRHCIDSFYPDPSTLNEL
jgi:hypothetical protein